MSSDGEEDIRPRGSVEFVECSVLDSIVPASTNLDIETALNSSVATWAEGGAPSLAHIQQRQSLFFDESVDVFVVLQTPFSDEAILRSYLARLVIVLEARVVNAIPEHYDGPANNEIIFCGPVQGNEQNEPVVIVQPPDESARTDGHILVVWKLSVFLSRPQRLRPHNPSITFAATANLKSEEQVATGIKEDEYMQSKMPAGLNLLDSFSNDEALGSTKPWLSAHRVSRIVPTNKVARDLMRPFRNVSRRTFRIAPAFSARVRYAKPNSTPSRPSVIASLDVDITPYVNNEIFIESVELTVPEGTVEDLNNFGSMTFPIKCLPRDDVTFLYRLFPSDLDLMKSNVKAVNIAIKARAIISEFCRPLIHLRWTTSIDFSVPVNPGFNAPTTTMTRENRPSNLSISSSTFENVPTMASLAVTRPDALPSMELTTRHQRSSSIPDFGVTMTFTSHASQPPQVGEEFTWEVFIVNRSDRPRKLGLYVLPRRRRPTNHATSNRPISASYVKDAQFADAVTDENILYAIQRNAAIEPADIVCLSTDIRIGPLAPNACQAIELRFLPMKAGVIGVDCVRVRDMTTSEYVDIKDLPSIIVTGTDMTRC